MEPNKHHGFKAFLIFVSIVVGVIVFLSLALERIPATEKVNVGGFWSPVYEDHPTTELSLKNQSTTVIIFSSLFGLGVAFLYTVLAAAAICAFQEIRAWAYLGKVEPLLDEEVLSLAAFWPLALVAGIIIYSFVGVINRVF